jgi:hypothetical protein
LEGISANGNLLYENQPSCPESGGSGASADFAWTFAVSQPVVSNFQLLLCLDIRSCKEDDSSGGPRSTVPVADFADGFGREHPPTLRVVHHPRPQAPKDASACACEDQVLPLVQSPGFDRVFAGAPPWAPLADPAADVEIPDAVAFVGSGCTELIVPYLSVSMPPSSGRLRPPPTLPPQTRANSRAPKRVQRVASGDFITVQLHVPASTRVRLRAASDSVAACYLGSSTDP